VRFVEVSNPRLLYFMDSMVSGSLAGAKHVSGRFVQTFLEAYLYARRVILPPIRARHKMGGGGNQRGMGHYTL
jgi:hypothetical protein